MSNANSFAKSDARQRITQVVEGWFLTEPLLFAAWTMHDVVLHQQVETIRVGRGKIEYNPEFIASLKRVELRSVLAFEAMRILLGHPYARRQPNAELSYQASNLAIQECLRTKLPIPRARDVFGDEQFDDQYFEFYYRELDERASDRPQEPPADRSGEDRSDGDQPQGDPSGENSDPPSEPGQRTAAQDASDAADSDAADSDAGESNVGDGEERPSGGESSDPADDGGANDASPSQTRSAAGLGAYADPQQVGLQNTGMWDHDDLQRDEINAAVREAAESGGWGTIGGAAKEQLLATLQPKLDYRGVLRNFRQSVLSVQRRLTRMKPSRRFGFSQMGSRYDFTTKLLFAVDVSGSMGRRDLQLGFSVVSRFFRYGVESIDVIWFDEQIRSAPLTLRRARSAFEITGRGGTNFKPLIDFIDQHREYDGLIIFTDGYAPPPPRPKNRRTRILWLFKDEATHEQMHPSLRKLGRSAFLKQAAV